MPDILNKNSLIPDLRRIRASLVTKRRSWLLDCRRLAKLFFPRVQDYLDETNKLPEDKSRLNNKAKSSVPIQALNTLSAGMQAGLISPGRPWFRRQIADFAYRESKATKEWLVQVEKLERDLLGRSNFYAAMARVFKSSAAFGNSVLFVMPDPVRYLKFFFLNPGTYCFSENEFGEVDTVFRELNFTARQIYNYFGEEKLSLEARNALNNPGLRESKTFEIIHAVFPNPQSENRIWPWPWLDIYYYQSANDFDPAAAIRISGFNEQPFAVFRWTEEDIYGGCPAIDVYPDASQLDEMEAEKLIMYHLMARPPMMGPANLNMSPGAFNPDYGNQADIVRPAMDTRFNTAPLAADIKEIERRIKEGLYVNLFQTLLSSPYAQRTATEINALQDERVFALGEVVERFHSSLDIIMDRVFSISLAAGIYPEPPPELQGSSIQMEYTSILAQAQKVLSLGSLNQFLNFLGANAVLFPQINDSYNYDKAIDIYADMLNIDPVIINSQETRENLRQQKAQAAAAQLQAQAAQEGAQMVETLSKATKNAPASVSEATGYGL